MKTPLAVLMIVLAGSGPLRADDPPDSPKPFFVLATSDDDGETWSKPRPTEPPGIRQPNARFHVRRLASGKLLLVKHGDRIDAHEGRVKLSAWLSADDGASWQGGLMLDERPGVSYPDGQETPDGLIRIIYDYNRVTDRSILVATFREQDVAAGKDVSGAVRLRQLVSKASGGLERPPASKAAAANADGKPAIDSRRIP